MALHDHQQRFAVWMGYSIALPLAVVFCTAAVASAVLDIRNVFVGVFARGEVLPMAAVLVLGAAAEIQQVLQKHEDTRGAFFLILQIACVTIGVILLVSYGLIRARVMVLVPVSPDASTQLLLFKSARLSVAALAFAVAFAVYVRTNLMLDQTEMTVSQ